MPSRLRYLLLQVRDPDDPIREHEIECFARAFEVPVDRISIFDLLSGAPTARRLAAADVVLLGGSGDYCVSDGGPWLEPALDTMRELHRRRQPTFASCWGCQAMALALGGAVVRDMARAELGTLEVQVTDAGRADPVFGPLAPSFPAQAGHQDIIDALPPDATLLASTTRVPNQAFRFDDRPIYCTQFHPELSLEDLLVRLRTYPEYVERIAGMPFDEFAASCRESAQTTAVLQRFVRGVLAD
ncbi:MAG: type 1 glutamine amidotransferase [Phycisphaerales bacterium]|nr:type 1 glutamine amidotransferase [Phycisphaerales bacterium]